MQILHAFSCLKNCVTNCMHIFMPQACMHSSCMHENACKCANSLACLMHELHAACMPACMIHPCSAGMHSLEGLYSEHAFCVSMIFFHLCLCLQFELQLGCVCSQNVKLLIIIFSRILFQMFKWFSFFSLFIAI